jgi:hypothetical protein
MNPKPLAQIHLTLKADRTLEISGPTEDRIVFLGMLELARDAVNHHHHAQEQRIVIAPADLLKGTP